MEAIAVVIMFLIVIAASHAFAKAQREAKRRLKEWGVPRAAEIAKYQGWVSPYRLKTQANMSNGNAQFVLREACKVDLIYQAVDGRYYSRSSPPLIPISNSPEMVTRQEVDELRNSVLEITKSIKTYSQEQSAAFAQRSDAEAAQADQVTAHITALCAITATLALLLADTGMTLDSIIKSIEASLSAIDPQLRKNATPIFDAVIRSLRQTQQASGETRASCSATETPR